MAHSIFPARLDDDEPADPVDPIAPAMPVNELETRLFNQRKVLIFGGVNDKLARDVTGRLLALAGESDKPIDVYINSPGGHVESGDTIHDMIRFVDKIAPVRVIGTGWVASAGALIFLAGAKERRVCLPNTRFLLHQPSGGVRVFLGADFVTVTKSDAAGWQGLKPLILGTIMEHFVAGRPVILGEEADADEDTLPEDAEIVAQIKELLDTRVRPAVASDGGDIVFRGFRDGIVRLHMQGACSGCPSSSATLKHGIENMLRHYVPEVRSVEQVMF